MESRHGAGVFRGKDAIRSNGMALALRRVVRAFGGLVLSLALLAGPQARSSSVATTAVCTSSGPSSGAYVVKVCLSAPASGSTLVGNATVTGTVSIVSGSGDERRLIFYLDGAYLLSDYQSPYTFTLPTGRWVDGSHALAVGALMNDGFMSKRAQIAVTFQNGVSTPPVNQQHFQPTSGRPANGQPFVVAAAGDGASGESNAGNVVGRLKSINPNLFLYLGDVYEQGSVAEFFNWYGTASTYFGQFRAITDPTVGNHEYLTSDAKAYFDYWDNIPKYYSFNANGWHFISLNSNSTQVSTASGSAQYNWLKSDLGSLPAGACTIVYYHHPYFNIGPEGSATWMSAIWTLLVQHHVRIVLNGHDHDYQRWKALDGSGNVSSSGTTEFVVGTAGHGLQTFTGSDSRVAYSNDANPQAFGVLLLRLDATGASFRYVNASGSVLDSGSVPCVSASPSAPGATDDFDGDGKADPARYEPATHTASWLKSSNGAWASLFMGNGTFDYVGRSDFDGDGKTDPAEFMPGANALWFHKSSSNTWNGVYMGPGSYSIVPGSDFDGDGKTDPALFLPGANALWYRKSSTGSWQGVYLGPGSYQVMPGCDFDGDGKTDPAIFIPGSAALWYRKSSTSTWQGIYMGAGSYEIVPGSDFDGDGKTDPALFMPSTNTLWYRASSKSSWVGVYMGSGSLTYVPAADFDGDGKTDPAQFTPAAHALWYLKSTTGTWTGVDTGAGTYQIVN